MTPTPLTRALRASAPWLNEEAARNLLTTLGHAIVLALTTEQSVKIPVVGRLTLVHSPPRKGRNPRNPTVDIVIPAKQRVKFSPSPWLRANTTAAT